MVVGVFTIRWLRSGQGEVVACTACTACTAKGWESETLTRMAVGDISGCEQQILAQPSARTVPNMGCLFLFSRDLVGTLEPGNEQAKAHVPGDLGRDRQPQALACTAEDRDRDPRTVHGTPRCADIMYLECSARLANAA